MEDTVPRSTLPLLFALLACGVLDCGGSEGAVGRTPTPPPAEPSRPAARPPEPAAIVAVDVPEPSHSVPAGAPHALVRVPEGFRADEPWELVVFLHGWNGCVNVLMRSGATYCVGDARDPVEGWDLAGVFDRAGRNALFLMPQLAFQRRDGDAGHFADDGYARRFLEAVAERVDAWPDSPPSRILLTAHSAGFETALAWLRHGDVVVDEVVLFDALYAGAEGFARWVMESEDRRLVSIHTGRGSTRRQSGRLRRIATIGELPVGASLSSDARVVILESDAPHRDVPRAHLVDAVRGPMSRDATATENQ